MTTATTDVIEVRLSEALVEFGVEPGDITRDAEFAVIDVDSLDLVELAQIVEEEWGVVLKGDDVKDLKTVGDAVDLVASRLS